MTESALLYRPTDGCIYAPSILHQIRMAETEEQLNDVVGRLNAVLEGVSAGTRRKCLRAAAAKRKAWA